MASKKRIVGMLLILISTILIVSACSKQDSNTDTTNEPISKTEFVLGTVVSIKIYDNASDEVFNKVFDRLREIENKMTINSDDSEVISINSKAGKDYVQVSDDTFYVIKKGKEFSELSKGRFDISIGPLVKLWNIGTESAHVPTSEEIESKKILADYNNVILNESEKSVMLKEEGMILDLGGIAKGYGADVVVNILEENNVKHAIINLGGNIFAYGNKPDGSPWKVGIQNPFSSRGDYIGIAEAVNQTIVTSGIYERFYEENGKKYHHILDPDTGYPVGNNLAGISIIADSSIDADSLSTAAFALGLDEGMQLIEKLDNVEAVFVTVDSEAYVTSGLKDKFKLTDTNFILMQ